MQNGVAANGANVGEPSQGDLADAESTKSLASNQSTPSGDETTNSLSFGSLHSPASDRENKSFKKLPFYNNV